jgi:hypothetical protein
MGWKDKQTPFISSQPHAMETGPGNPFFARFSAGHNDFLIWPFIPTHESVMPDGPPGKAFVQKDQYWMAGTEFFE